MEEAEGNRPSHGSPKEAGKGDPRRLLLRSSSPALAPPSGESGEAAAAAARGSENGDRGSGDCWDSDDVTSMSEFAVVTSYGTRTERSSTVFSSPIDLTGDDSFLRPEARGADQLPARHMDKDYRLLKDKEPPNSLPALREQCDRGAECDSDDPQHWVTFLHTERKEFWEPESLLALPSESSSASLSSHVGAEGSVPRRPSEWDKRRRAGPLLSLFTIEIIGLVCAGLPEEVTKFPRIYVSVRCLEKGSKAVLVDRKSTGMKPGSSTLRWGTVRGDLGLPSSTGGTGLQEGGEEEEETIYSSLDIDFSAASAKTPLLPKGTNPMFEMDVSSLTSYLWFKVWNRKYLARKGNTLIAVGRLDVASLPRPNGDEVRCQEVLLETPTEDVATPHHRMEGITGFASVQLTLRVLPKKRRFGNIQVYHAKDEMATPMFVDWRVEWYIYDIRKFLQLYEHMDGFQTELQAAFLSKICRMSLRRIHKYREQGRIDRFFPRNMFTLNVENDYDTSGDRPPVVLTGFEIADVFEMSDDLSLRQLFVLKKTHLEGVSRTRGDDSEAFVPLPPIPAFTFWLDSMQEEGVLFYGEEYTPSCLVTTAHRSDLPLVILRGATTSTCTWADILFGGQVGLLHATTPSPTALTPCYVSSLSEIESKT